jgi:hypothetical protein
MEADWLDIWLIAGLLVDEHGNRALAIAKARAERALKDNDRGENAIWCAVGAAAEQYLCGARPEGTAQESIQPRRG